MVNLILRPVRRLRELVDHLVNLILRPVRRLRELVDQPDGWQARHFAVAPFGGLLSTWLWVSFGPAWAQIDNFGVLFYGAVAVLLEGGYQMFYAISKRRRDINAAEDRGREQGHLVGREEGREEGHLAGREEGREEGRRETSTAVLDTIADRRDDDPSDVLKAVIAELRAQSQSKNGRPE